MGPNLSETTIRQRISMAVNEKLKHIPPEKRRKKMRHAYGWWAVAFVFGSLACFIAYRVIEAATHGTNVPTILALVAIGLPVFVALFAANTASGEVTRAALTAILSFGRSARDVIKKPSSNEPPVNDQ